MKKLFFLLALMVSIGLAFTSCNNSKSTKTEQLAADETYTCEMHNEVMGDHAGKCPKCGMNLTKQKMTEEQKKMKAEGTFVKPKE
jgi:hypothetical protein